MRRLSLLLLLLLPATLGCSPTPSTVEAWVSSQGGAFNDLRLEARARAAATAVLGGRADVRVKISILNRDDLTAFSWPSGRLYLSRGLLTALDEQLLRAAVAHEIAHLLTHHGNVSVAALRSDLAPLEFEAAADCLGAGLLAATGTPARRDGAHALSGAPGGRPSVGGQEQPATAG